MLISIIIPIYQRTEWIERCLAALSEQDKLSGIEMEVIVVDDGSPNRDQIEAIINKNRYNFTLAFLTQAKKGPAAAKNLGIREAGGEVICFIDDDSIPNQHWFQSMARCIMENPAAGMINGRTLSFNHDDFSRLLEASIHKPSKRWATYNIAYRKKTIDFIGNFDERYTLASWEDNDLGFRAWRAGIKHLYCEDAVICHVHEKTMAELKQKGRRNGSGLAVFVKKYIAVCPHLALGGFFYVIKDIFLVMVPWVFVMKSTAAKRIRFFWAVYTLEGFLRELFLCRA